MKPDRWRKVDELFEAALEREPHSRAAFLDKACGDDVDLRREVEKMLSFERQAEDFIQTDVFDVAARLISQPQEPDSQVQKVDFYFRLNRRCSIHSRRRALRSLSHCRIARTRRNG